MKPGLWTLIKEDKNHFGLPNLLSITRLIILPFILLFLAKETRSGDTIAFVLIVLSGTTDFFDGYFARKLDKRSQLGRILDPVIDKVNVGVIMLFLAAHRGLPYWFAFLVIGRDILIMIAGFRIISKKRFISESNFLGKITLTSFILIIILYVLNLFTLARIMMWLSVILILSSLIKYSVFYKKLMGRNKIVVRAEKEATFVED